MKKRIMNIIGWTCVTIIVSLVAWIWFIFVAKAAMIRETTGDDVRASDVMREAPFSTVDPIKPAATTQEAQEILEYWRKHLDETHKRLGH